MSCFSETYIFPFTRWKTKFVGVRFVLYFIRCILSDEYLATDVHTKFCYITVGDNVLSSPWPFSRSSPSELLLARISFPSFLRILQINTTAHTTIMASEATITKTSINDEECTKFPAFRLLSFRYVLLVGSAFTLLLVDAVVGSSSIGTRFETKRNY